MTSAMPITVIAEAGVNHNGDMDMARALIDAAAEAGADYVKFQSFRADKLASKQAPKAAYQIDKTGAGESQYDMLKKLELSQEQHRLLQQHCLDRQIRFLSTPFDIDSLHMLVQEFDLDVIKLGSSEVTNAPLLLAAAQTGRKVILSTGMSDMADIHDALSVLAFGYLTPDARPGMKAFAAAAAHPDAPAILQEMVTLLHCTTQYPTPFTDVNLRAMHSMAAETGLDIGYSDHTNGIAVSLAAGAMGATLIEKHFTLDRNLPGPDHAASLEPNELCALVRGLREIEAALGDGVKQVAESEQANKAVARKSLVAARDIKAGQVLTEDMLTVKRPGTGRSPMQYWDILGTVAGESWKTDDPVC